MLVLYDFCCFVKGTGFEGCTIQGHEDFRVEGLGFEGIGVVGPQGFLYVKPEGLTRIWRFPKIRGTFWGSL